MARVHLFELEDQSWFPAAIREPMTDFLSFIGHLSEKSFQAFARRLREAMQATGDTTLVDLCSGGTGPTPVISRLLRQREQYPVKTIATDLFPNVDRFEFVRRRTGEPMELVPHSVDARAVPRELAGFRFICNAFHHFRPEDARRILQDAVSSGQGIAVVEMVDRSVPAVLSTLFSPLTIALTTPFIRPFKWSRLFFTYLVPLVPLCSVWDGVVSCLRVYSPEELRALVASLEPNDYEWDIGRLDAARGPAKLTYLIGRPRSSAMTLERASPATGG